MASALRRWEFNSTARSESMTAGQVGTRAASRRSRTWATLPAAWGGVFPACLRASREERMCLRRILGMVFMVSLLVRILLLP
jgi:hypothetical protein